MAGRVYNALGGTPESPCPTIGTEYCSLGDVRSWREAAARLYQRGILPVWHALVEVSTSAPQETDNASQLHVRVKEYADGFNGLPAGSLWSADKNRELITSTIALMQDGDALIEDLRLAIEATGNTPPSVLLPAPPEAPIPKSAWTRWLLPVGAVSGVLVVIGLSAAAAVTIVRERRGARAA